jgi:hypothetical protein
VRIGHLRVARCGSGVAGDLDLPVVADVYDHNLLAVLVHHTVWLASWCGTE